VNVKKLRNAAIAAVVLIISPFIVVAILMRNARERKEEA
jgi:hypothetical protein